MVLSNKTTQNFCSAEGFALIFLRNRCHYPGTVPGYLSPPFPGERKQRPKIKRDNFRYYFKVHEAYQALKKISSKKTIGLAGFSNNELCSSLTPAITVVHQPAFEMGQAAMTLLTQLVESKTPVRNFEKRILEPGLLIRTSSIKKN